MKNKLILSLSLSLFLGLLSSCSKDELQNSQESNSSLNSIDLSQYIPNLSDCYQGVTIDEGILRFESAEAFRQTIECLASKSDEMDSLFLVDFGGLNDSILNDTIIAMGYSEDLVYVAFENHFGYTSLRKSLDEATIAYLDSIGIDTTVNEDPNHVLGGKDIQTVFTHQGVVNVDDTLLYITPIGIQYYVTNGDYVLLDSILNGTWSRDTTHVIVHSPNGTSSRGSCKATYSTSWMWWYRQINNQWWAMRGKEGFYNIIWANKWYSTTESFKQKNGTFKGYKMDTAAGFDSYISNNDFGDCGNESFQSQLGDYDDKQSYTHDSPDYSMFRIDNGDHICSHANEKLPTVKWRSCTW